MKLQIQHTPGPIQFCLDTGLHVGCLFVDATQSPHSCGVPNCPGPINLKRLEVFEELLAVAQDAYQYFAMLADRLPHLVESELRFSQREPRALRDRLRAATAKAPSPQA